MSDPQIMIAYAFPKHEADRARLRAKLPGVPLTAIYKEGVDMPCGKCGMVLNVGPRVAAILAKTPMLLCCPWCVVKVSREMEFDIMHMGNPDSKFEGEE